MRDLLAALVGSNNRFVLTTRYVTRLLRLLRDAPARLEIVQMPPLEVAELRDALAVGGFTDAEELARVVHALADGHGGHASALVSRMQALSAHGGTDAVSALAAMMEPGAEAARAIGWCYELRLHRARGYGALKGILGILAEEEPLTLTEMRSACSARQAPRRTTSPGSRTWTSSRCTTSGTDSPTRSSACGCGCTAAPSLRPTTRSQPRFTRTRSPVCHTPSLRWRSPARVRPPRR